MSRKVDTARLTFIAALFVCISVIFVLFSPMYAASGTITNILIERQGDAAGSNIVLSWMVKDTGIVDIWTKTGDFDTNSAIWKLEPQFTNISGNSTIDRAVKVGDGTSKWYKIVLHGTSLTDKMITHEVLGKFDYSLKIGNNLISLPLEPFDTNIDSVIGGQLAGGPVITADRIWTFKDNAWKRSYLDKSGKWRGSIKNMDIDLGYWITISPRNKAKYVTIVGKTVASDRQIIFVQGDNLIGSAYPVAVPLGDLGLNTQKSFTEGNISKADKIVWYNGSSYDNAYLSSATHTWKGDKLNKLVPGRGYFVTKRGQGQVKWTYKKPY